MSFLDSELVFIKGVGTVKADALKTELGVTHVRDFLQIFPYRYIDKTKVQKISEARADGDVLLFIAKLVHVEKITGKFNKSRLVALVKDDTGFIELVWFQKIKYVEPLLVEGQEYVIYGRVNLYGSKKSIPHPEFEALIAEANIRPSYDPVYSSTEKLDRVGLDSKVRRKILHFIFERLTPSDFPENLPTHLVQSLKLCSRLEALQWVHFPASDQQRNLAQNRIKFEEFFWLQVELLFTKQVKRQQLKGAAFEIIGHYFKEFYDRHLPFSLTNAQKRVIKEIRADMGSGAQMNRLLQGDVGSGKTIVALLSMLMAADNGYQACLMAPTEILASQHFKALSELLLPMGIEIGFLTGSVKGKKRVEVLEKLESGGLLFLVGTHALIEDHVVFQNLGLAIIDEQHKFGVAQRSKLWQKNRKTPPHILVMTATPIPRTLAMTLYGDLEVSVIDELPPGRKEIKTIHKTEGHRPEMIRFLKEQIALGRQVYIVYPLIEESEQLDLQNLQEGYERLLPHFPAPEFQISVVHGRMKPQDKESEMQRFVRGTTQIMVATTVIEVGVNVPNASVMVIENSERFGLSQLHQLRGRVGRGAEQSFCILMTGYKLSQEAKFKMSTMVRTNNGFEIAEADLQLRGPGEITGTRQSGVVDFKLLNIVKDLKIVNAARYYAEEIITNDPLLEKPENLPVRNHLSNILAKKKDWGRIS